MKNIYLFINLWLLVFLFNQNKSFCQNLVLNPSFESVNIPSLQCSWYLTNAQFTSAVSNWDYPTQGSTDLYHMSLATSCFSHPLSTNASAVGQQLPRTGSAMTNIVTYGSGGCTPYREYVQGELSTPLLVGTTYNISIYVSLADYSNKGTNNIGLKFTTIRQSTGSMCVWQTTPDVNYTGTPIMDKIGWTEITYQFTPTTSNLLYFSIGNFITDSGTLTTNTTDGGYLGTIRYFIDDISISPANNSCNLVANAGINQTIDCNNPSVTLNGSATNGTTPYIYSWSPTTGLSNPNIANPIASPTTTTTYTLTVTDAASCLSTSSTTVTTSSTITPLFTQINPICEGTNLSSLPTTSINGINGSWSPAINNTITTTYTFTPNNLLCASTTTMTIIVNQKTDPIFTQITPICEGTNLAALPNTSLNNIIGIWSPAINNLLTTTYIFTPNTGLCANTSSMTIVVNPKVTPTFSIIAPLCYGTNFILPINSTNNISGTWLPLPNLFTSTNYTFTPNINECAISTNIDVTILDDFDFEITDACIENDFILTALPLGNSINENTANYSWQFNNQNIGTNSSSLNVTSYINSTITIEELPMDVYLTITNSDGCSKVKNFLIENMFCGIQKGISPNGDGLNDFFDLRLLNVKKLSIFNRYGVKVYNKNDYSNEWYGESNNGNKLPDGAYYFLIEFKNNRESKVGWIYINRIN